MKTVTRRSKYAIYLPPAMHGKLQELATTAGIAGAEHMLVEKIIEGLIDSTVADILIDVWGITNPDTIAELYRIQSGAPKIVAFPNGQPCPVE